MRDDAIVYRAPPALGMAELRRRLGRCGAVSARARCDATVEFMDTLDDRLRRAGLGFTREPQRLVLRAARDGEWIASCAWRRASAPRTGADLPAGELRTLVEPLIAPRVLLPVFSACWRERCFALAWPDGGKQAGVRWVRAAPRGERSGGEVAWVVVMRTRPRRRRALERAFTGTGLRRVDGDWLRMLRRAAGRHDAPAPRPNLALDGSETLRRVAAALLRHLLLIMERNEVGVREDLDPECLHDFRVALRRTRIVLAQMPRVLPAASTRSFRKRFAEVSHACGRLRDLDVELLRRGEYEELVPVEVRAGLSRVFARVEEERAREQAAFRDYLLGAPYRRLKREWRGAIRDLDAGVPLGLDADEPAVPVARRLLGARVRRIRSELDTAGPLDDAALHRLRIECKKLRYLIEFFAALVEDAGERLERLERVQDALGEYNDLRVQAERLAQARRPAPGSGVEAAEAEAIGAVLAVLERRRARARARCDERLRELSGRRFARVTLQVRGDRSEPNGRSGK